MDSHEIITRKEAIERGLKRYFMSRNATRNIVSACSVTERLLMPHTESGMLRKECMNYHWKKQSTENLPKMCVNLLHYKKPRPLV